MIFFIFKYFYFVYSPVLNLPKCKAIDPKALPSLRHFIYFSPKILILFDRIYFPFHYQSDL